MKTNINITFEGTVSELVAFLTSTFVNPESLTLTVTAVGAVSKPELPVGYPELAKLVGSWVDQEKLLREYPSVIALINPGAPDTGYRINAIKQLRSITNLGLKEAKDFVIDVLEPKLK